MFNLVNFDSEFTETSGGRGNSSSGWFWVVGLGLDFTDDLCFLECVVMFPRRLLLMFGCLSDAGRLQLSVQSCCE